MDGELRFTLDNLGMVDRGIINEMLEKLGGHRVSWQSAYYMERLPIVTGDEFQGSSW